MDENKCILIGNVFANTMQFIVCLLSISVLFFHKICIENDIFRIQHRLFKINKENQMNKRTWTIWFMDNSKQAVSSAIAHIYTTYIARIFTLGNEKDDECGWFLIQFVVDTVLGILFSFIISKFSIYLFNLIMPIFSRNWLIIGNYNSNGIKYKYYVWILQVFHWVCCSMLARVLCTCFIFITLSYWKELNIMFSNLWINNRYNELVFVILGMPIILNSIQFLITNWYLKWQRPKLNQFITQQLLYENTNY
jgi:hypothetical protein